jgi:hypothetical protein
MANIEQFQTDCSSIFGYFRYRTIENRIVNNPLLLAFFRFQMDINEFRSGVKLIDPFTAYGSLYGNLNAMMT